MLSRKAWISASLRMRQRPSGSREKYNIFTCTPAFKKSAILVIGTK